MIFRMNLLRYTVFHQLKKPSVPVPRPDLFLYGSSYRWSIPKRLFVCLNSQGSNVF